MSRSSSRSGGAAAPRNTRAVAGRPAVSPLQDPLARLTNLPAGRHRVVSCYLKLEPRDRSRGKYLIKLKNRVRAMQDALPGFNLPRDVEDAARRDLDRVVDHLRDPANLPGTQGIAIFACEALDLFEAIPLPLVYRSRLAVDPTPLVRELASLEDEFGRILTVVVDRTGARFFEVTAYDASELPGIVSPSTRGSRFRGDQNGPGWGEHTYHNRIREEKQRHFETVARQLFTFDRRQPAHGIVIAGTGADAKALEPFLHTYLAERLMGSVTLNPKEVTPPIVHQATLAVREEWERMNEKLHVEDVAEGLGSGWAVNGARDTLRALARGQVRTLLVHPDASVGGFRCADSGRLALTERDCRGEGEPLPVVDVVDDAIEEALRQHVAVDVVYESEAQAGVDGLAALLRFR